MEKQKTGYPSIDKPWMKYYEKGLDQIKTRDESMFQMLERCSRIRLDSIALELRVSDNGFKEGPKFTYGQYLDKIKEAARSLYVLGVKKNEIVPFILPNIPESRILIYALNIIGATSYPISPMLSPSAFQNIIAENKIKVVVIYGGFFEKFYPIIQNSDVSTVIYIGNEPDTKLNNILSWNEFDALKEKYTNDIAPYYSPDHIAAIIGTSGTTGTPKGVCLTDRNINALALGQGISKHFYPGALAMDALIQSIGYGISSAHSLGCIGCHTILIPELITNIFPKLLCEIKPDCYPGGPVHWINLARSKEFAEGKAPCIFSPISGGASLDKGIEKLLNGVDEGYTEKIGDKLFVRQGYGSTECCGAATYSVVGSYKFGSIGIPMANVTVSIFKPGTDKELTYGEEGEICVCGETVMQGYLNNPEETAKVLKLHSDGKIWLHQADLGWCDPDGHIFITDRIKNIFMRTGFNVHPSKIAEFISELDKVRDCVVVGVPHPEEQMVPVAFVVLDDKEENYEEIKTKLTKECKNNLDSYAIPYEWFFVNELPRNSGGKIDTNMLVEMCNVKYM